MYLELLVLEANFVRLIISEQFPDGLLANIDPWTTHRSILINGGCQVHYAILEYSINHELHLIMLNFESRALIFILK